MEASVPHKTFLNYHSLHQQVDNRILLQITMERHHFLSFPSSGSTLLLKTIQGSIQVGLVNSHPLGNTAPSYIKQKHFRQ